PSRRGRAAADDSVPPVSRRLGSVYQIRTACGLDSQERYYYGGGPPPVYAPADYGEARMACLGWLYEMARAKDQGDAYLKDLRAAKDKAGADPRPAWDWYYLAAVRQVNKDVFAAALALSKAAPGPAADIAFLTALGSRPGLNTQPRRRGADGKDPTPPLPADQVAHVLDCFARLKRQKPEWATAVSGSVRAELKRAKREAEEKALYDEAVAAASTVEAVQAALQMAAGRDDLDAFLALFGKLEKLQGPPKGSGNLSQLPTRQAANPVEALMAKRAEAKRLDDVLRLSDLFLATARRQNLTAPRTASSARRPYVGPLNLWYPSKGGGQRQVQLAFPLPNDYYDDHTISVLHYAFLLYKDADLLSDLFAHARKQAAGAEGGDRLYAHLALGYLHWWNEEKDDALDQLAAAVKLAPADHTLTLEVAGLREQGNDPAAALALLDGITPTDHNVMLRREEAALRLAERTGNVARARQAAERLFGLRLDPDKQLELAGQMHRLGMHKEAEAVVARAQRQAGNKTAVLVRLMTQYQAQNQPELAVQLARQILRKVPAASAAQNPRYSGGNENDGFRSAAVGVLARSGQLKDVIERAEAQLKASPKSVALNQTLLAYYQAAGDRDKQKQVVKTLSALKPEDGNVRWQTAQQLLELGDRDAALAEYKVAIKLAPGRFGDQYWQVIQTFTQANKFEELAAILDEIDLRKLQYYWSVAQVINPMLENEKTRPVGLKLFKKAWDAFPNYRASLLSQVDRDEVWRRPEIFDYARQAVIPRGDGDVDPWAAATEISSYGQNGQVTGVVTRLLAVARKQQRLPELRAEAAAALASRPDWHAGKALVAIIDIQTGQKERGLAAWKELFDGPAGADVPPVARFVLTQELEFYAGVEDTAVKTLEGGIDAMLEDGNSQFEYSPARRLAWWYEQLGRTEESKKLARRFASSEPTNPGYGGGYWEYQKTQRKLSIARTLLQAGDVVEAVRVYNSLLADRDTLATANQYYGGAGFDQQAEAGLREAMKALKPAALPAAVGALLTPPEKPADGQPLVDFVLAIESRDLPRTRIGSLTASALAATADAEPARAAAAAKLAELAKARPNDLSVLSAAALLAFAEKKPEAVKEAVDRLAAAVEKAPLEALPPNGRANARQRADALNRVPVWLVARECLKNDKDREPLRPAGEKLAAAALAGAKRAQDQSYAVAILREWGQLDLDRGDKAKAEARWAELLELALPKPKADGANRRTSADTGPGRSVAQASLPVPQEPGPQYVVFRQPPAVAGKAPAGPAPPGLPSAAPVVTAEQFQEAYELAKLAADQGMTALSVRAFAEAVRGGPPLPPKRDNRGGRSYRQITVNGQQYLVGEDQTGRRLVGVARALADLVPKWREKGVAAADVYRAALGAVLPDARPAEVFLYADATRHGEGYILSSNGSWTPVSEVPGETESEDRGVPGLLAEVALEAGMADDLRSRLEARLDRPLAEVPARVTLLALAIKQADDARAGALLAAFAEKAEKDPTQATLDAAAAAARAALARPPLAKTAEDLLLKLALRYATGNNLGKAETVGQQLIEHHLGNRDFAAAKRLTDLAVTLGKKFAAGNAEVPRRAAEYYLRAGFPEEALAQYAVYADMNTADRADPSRRGRRPEPAVERFDLFVRLLLGLPADKRYAALAGWSLPSEGRKSVRYFVGGTPRDVPPPAFGPAAKVPPAEPVSTMLMLADAAKECGKLDELTATADKLAADKVENADLLRVLVYLRAGRGAAVEPQVKAFADAARQRMTAKDEERVGSRYYDNEGQQPAPVHPSEFLFAKLCRDDPKFADLTEPLLKLMLDRARGTYNLAAVPWVTGTWDRLGAARAGAADALDAPAALPARWRHPATPGARWFAQDGYLAGGASTGDALLLFDTPVAGTFEFSVDVFQGGWAEGHAGYAGVVFEPNRNGVESRVFPVFRAGEDGIGRPAPGIRDNDFNRLTIQAAPDKVRYLLNGQLVYEDTAPPPTSPWLMLYAGAGRKPVFRNPTLTGTPTVPAEVRLLAGDYLDGWSAHVYPANLPPRLRPKEEKPKPDENDPRARMMSQQAEGQPATPPVPDWLAKDGELTGRKLDRPGDRPVPSRLAYFRPLRPGEAVRYEFFHDPGKAHVHPSFGRLAFVLDPAGVKLRWLVDAVAGDWTGLPAENDLDDPAGKKASPAIKAGDWNTAAVSVTADAVKVEVNGAVVYEGPIPAGVERTFGFYHDRAKTAARVRNAVLTGPWPKSVEPAAVAFATTPESPAAARARRWQLGERYYFTEAADVVARSKGLPPAERYDALAGWVLPTPARPAFQLAGAFTPQDGLGADKPAAGRRVFRGGRLDIPAVELVAAAEAAGKLDDLADRLVKAPPGDPLAEAGRQALLAVVRAAQGKADEAAGLLAKIAERTKGLAADANAAERWPTAVALAGCLGRP
ncbi:MAG: DUF1583 domain-containing protein, partial [Gemmataceae bacterium]|nr:DUF1583 domain-containing protein [Gemmataceae bacterium]